MAEERQYGYQDDPNKLIQAAMAHGYPEPQQASDVVRWQLAADDIIDELRHNLRGESWDFEKREYTRKEGDMPLLNEKGVSDVLKLASSYVNRNTFLSNFEDEHIRKTAVDAHIELVELCLKKGTDWNLDTRDRDLLVKMVVDGTIYPALRRAFMEGERKYLKSTQRISETILRDERKKEDQRGFGIFGGGGK